MALLDEHARVFPHGALREERSAERVLALCAIGQTNAAHEAAAAFLGQYTDSPLRARVRSSCANVAEKE